MFKAGDWVLVTANRKGFFRRIGVIQGLVGPARVSSSMHAVSVRIPGNNQDTFYPKELQLIAAKAYLGT